MNSVLKMEQNKMGQNLPHGPIFLAQPLRFIELSADKIDKNCPITRLNRFLYKPEARAPPRLRR